MKRWVVVVLVLAALVVLVSPGIVGRIAENNMQRNIDWAEDDAPQLLVETESFDRGWFSSEGRHRITLHRLASAVDADEAPALLINTRVDHGLVPFTSMSRDRGSLEPGLARALSTFQLDVGGDEPVELPGTAYSTIGLNGVTDVEYLLEQGSHASADGQADWEGAKINVHIDPNEQSATIDGAVGPLSFSSGRDRATLQALDIELAQRRSSYGFNVGDVDVTAEQIEFSSAVGSNVSIAGMQIVSTTSIDDKRVASASTATLKEVQVPGVGEIGVDIAVTVADLDAASIGKINAALKNAQAAADPDAAMAGIFPVIEDDLKTLLAAGGSMKFERFNVQLPQGNIDGKIIVDVAESNAGDFAWTGLPLLTTASVDLKIPRALVEMALMMNPQAQQIMEMGILKQNGDNYEILAEYAQGLLTLNGAPFPLPLPF